MRGSKRALLTLAGLAAVVALGGCGSDSGGGGVSDARIVSALGIERGKGVGGADAIDGNPFCSVTKLLGDPSEVSAADRSGKVIASRDATVGIEIKTPFAPRCSRKAQRALDKLASPKKGKARRGSASGGGKGKTSKGK